MLVLLLETLVPWLHLVRVPLLRVVLVPLLEAMAQRLALRWVWVLLSETMVLLLELVGMVLVLDHMVPWLELLRVLVPQLETMVLSSELQSVRAWEFLAKVLVLCSGTWEQALVAPARGLEQRQELLAQHLGTELAKGKEKAVAYLQWAIGMGLVLEVSMAMVGMRVAPMELLSSNAIFGGGEMWLGAVKRPTVKSKNVDDASVDLARHHNYRSRMDTFQMAQGMHNGLEADYSLYHEVIRQSSEH